MPDPESLDPKAFHDIAERLRREGYVGVSPALVAEVDQQMREGIAPTDVLGRAIMKELGRVPALIPTAADLLR